MQKQRVFIQSMKPSPYEDSTQAPFGSIKIRWDQKEHMQGTGASTSEVNSISVVPVLQLLFCWCAERFGFTGGLIEELMLFWAEKPKNK